MDSLDEIKEKIKSGYGTYFQNLSGLSADRLADEALDFKKADEQFNLLRRYVGELSGKEMLEIGSGFGMSLVVGINNYRLKMHGLEPSSEGFDDSLSISREILEYFKINPTIIREGFGENIPFPDNYFDIVYSTNVLEHVQNPEKVIQESIRVLKHGGYLQFVVPNFGSFWEGHYCFFWIPYLPLRLAVIYSRLLGKKSDYLYTLNFVNYFKLKKWLKKYLESDRIEIITLGEEIFDERMQKIDFSSWAGLGKVKRWAETANAFGISKMISRLLIIMKAFTPFVVTLKKVK